MLFIYSLLFWVVELWASPGLDAVSKGDLARYQKDHLAAQALYRKAVESGEPAAEAMARLRLLVYTGKFWRLGAWSKDRRALANAEGIDGELAWTDFHLLHLGLWGPAEKKRFVLLKVFWRTTRRGHIKAVLGDRRQAFLRALAELPSRDGLGEGLLQSGGMLPPNPGTWNLRDWVFGGSRFGHRSGSEFSSPELAWMDSGVMVGREHRWAGLCPAENPYTGSVFCGV